MTSGLVLLSNRLGDVCGTSVWDGDIKAPFQTSLQLHAYHTFAVITQTNSSILHGSSFQDGHAYFR
jgi:hypothetical protein